ncbi:MAG: SDR family oxidoreductase, partial [Phycisphaerales bacterium]|nr:SDR family oxidoreductase [Phycisphaerales bacterium]
YPGKGEIDTVQQALARHGTQAYAAHLDVRDSAVIDGFVAAATAVVGQIDILVNAAGTTAEQGVVGHSDALWERILDTNLTGAFRMTRVCLPGMIERRWGRIINIGSEVVHRAVSPFSAYVAAKAGQNGWTRSMASELAPFNITVNMISPGWIPVERHEHDPQDLKDGYRALIPMDRWGVPADVAGACAFLASDAAGFITGQNIHVNGGMTTA